MSPPPTGLGPRIPSAASKARLDALIPRHSARAPLVCKVGCTARDQTQRVRTGTALVTCTACMAFCLAHSVLPTPVDWPFRALRSAACHRQEMGCPDAPPTFSLRAALAMLVEYHRISGHAFFLILWPSNYDGRSTGAPRRPCRPVCRRGSVGASRKDAINLLFEPAKVRACPTRHVSAQPE